MRHRFTVFAAALSIVLLGSACPSTTAQALADSNAGRALAINAGGTFQDIGVWLYRNAAGKYRFGPAVVGTNETLNMPSPSPETGGAVAGVEIVRHSLDTLGYPMHISLVEKLFAASYQIEIDASDDGALWSYEYGDPIANEKPVTTTSAARPAFKVWGPFHGDAVPFGQAPEADLQAAFDFAKGALNSIGNLPAAQKDLTNYGVLFIDDGHTIWVEFGPRFASAESPHLGCQTKLGRDMVFGYDKQHAGQDKSGKFLQCF
ncbi:MAG TPA: hypothetical protein VGG89_03050 [Candidatus Baltobacteraceae bacterium]